MQYRLRSVRRKKRIQIEDRDKQILKLDRESKLISKDPDYKTEVLLDEPYQKGWKRLFVLRPEVAKSDKAEFYEGILDAISTVQYHYDRSFKRPRRKGRWHKYIFKELPRLYGISPYQWHPNRSKLNEEQRARFIKVEYWSQHYYRWEHHYEFDAPHLFELAIVPNIITTIKVGDALLEQRKAWIDDQFQQNGLQHRLEKLQKGGWNERWKDGTEKLKYRNPLKNKAKWDWEEE